MKLIEIKRECFINLLFIYFFEIKCQATLLFFQQLLMHLALQLQTAPLVLLALQAANAPLAHHVVIFTTKILALFKTFGMHCITTILWAQTQILTKSHWTARRLLLLFRLTISTPSNFACQMSMELAPLLITTPPVSPEQLLPPTQHPHTLFTIATQCMSWMLKWLKPWLPLSWLLLLCFILLDDALKDIWIFPYFLIFKNKSRFRNLIL